VSTVAELEELVLEPDEGDRIANLCGPFDENLRLIEQRLGIEIRNRGNRFQLAGPAQATRHAAKVLTALFAQSGNETLTREAVHMALLEEVGAVRDGDDADPVDDDEVVVRTRRGVVRGRGVLQKAYLKRIATHDLSFGVGPAGTGKTYLAVASAVNALERDRVRRIVLTRPAVEAGEKLGFLPGDMAQKVDPYLRPLYDALYEMLGFERVAKLVERSVIEVAPLAFMRGRTLNESFIILDEAQNTTPEQMKMFLTRIGFGSVAVVTGDVTQVDLPRAQRSGLRQALEILDGVRGISVTSFRKQDVVRHPMVQAVVEAYEAHDAREAAAGRGNPA